MNSLQKVRVGVSDIILLEKDLDVLKEGVVGGKITFGSALTLLIVSIWLSFFNDCYSNSFAEFIVWYFSINNSLR
ncbi:MAG: hypothetical protein ACRC8P_00960 [Spiroplasma sp.]